MFFSSDVYVLTDEQKKMYALEKQENFRWIFQIVATYSPYTLTDADFVPQDLINELEELGQFAEVAYSPVPIEFLLHNFSTLHKPEYPLEHYSAFSDAVFVSSYRGTLADLPVFIVFRPSKQQLVVSIAGSSSPKHAFQDLRAWRCPHPSGRGSVHRGFWDLYQGIQPRMTDEIRKAIETHNPAELILTGHSMGGTISYLLCLDLLASNNNENNNINNIFSLPAGLRVRIATFGCPRAGDAELVQNFLDLVSTFQKREGNDAFKDYSVKGYNDGVPALPPVLIGYRHFCNGPIYTEGGKLYQIPFTQCEHAAFRIKEIDTTNVPYPKGGHNYYNGRDLEQFTRRLNWLEQALPNGEGWQDRYLKISDDFYKQA